MRKRHLPPPGISEKQKNQSLMKRQAKKRR